MGRRPRAEGPLASDRPRQAALRRPRGHTRCRPQDVLDDEVPADGAAHTFDGNADQDTVVTHTLPKAFAARYVRFLPQEWRGGGPALRVELYTVLEDYAAYKMEMGMEAEHLM
eukprot:NODE_5568_length_501_cov_96.960177_g4160_i0.p3 GENE.NODE_5568_length_501_cov_96.960177_g4160_i0~~NODE_5568_length_501_cov_96.960177_g4160_i0.p3  ORF type:complete len:123 (-),score=38.20 NODE_5568_length_501_cov_96.960177_g4160_i0:133-471(-)